METFNNKSNDKSNKDSSIEISKQVELIHFEEKVKFFDLMKLVRI